eukprot:8900646-Karenia_brevis.AAC.1
MSRAGTMKAKRPRSLQSMIQTRSEDTDNVQHHVDTKKMTYALKQCSRSMPPRAKNIGGPRGPRHARTYMRHVGKRTRTFFDDPPL